MIKIIRWMSLLKMLYTIIDISYLNRKKPPNKAMIVKVPASATLQNSNEN